MSGLTLSLNKKMLTIQSIPNRFKDIEEMLINWAVTVTIGNTQRVNDEYSNPLKQFTNGKWQ